MIPAALDVDQMLADLNAVGWLDYKIEIACGFSKGYIAQLKRREDREVFYKHGARLYNFWFDHAPKPSMSPLTVILVTT